MASLLLAMLQQRWHCSSQRCCCCGVAITATLLLVQRCCCNVAVRARCGVAATAAVATLQLQRTMALLLLCITVEILGFRVGRTKVATMAAFSLAML